MARSDSKTLDLRIKAAPTITDADQIPLTTLWDKNYCMHLPLDTGTTFDCFQASGTDYRACLDRFDISSAIIQNSK